MPKWEARNISNLIFDGKKKKTKTRMQCLKTQIVSFCYQ